MMKKNLKIKRSRNKEKLKNTIKLKRSLVKTLSRDTSRLTMNWLAMNHCL